MRGCDLSFRYVLRIPGGDSALLLQEKHQLEGLSAQTSSASGAVISGLVFGAPPSLSPCPLQGLGNMRSAIMMTVCLLALATMIEGSRRRLQAVHRRDDLGVSDTNSSAGEIVAGRRLSSETGEDLPGLADDAATIVPEPATEPTTTAAHVPASSSSAVSSNEAPLEVIRLEDGTVLVERRGNFVGPPPPTPVNQPVAPATTEETVCEPMAYGGYDLQDVECQDMVPASNSSATAAAPTGGDGRVLPAPERGPSTAALRERARALRRRLGTHPRLLHPMLSQHSERLHPLQERLAPPELEGHASLSRVTASMLRAADMRPLASKPSCPLYAVITQVQHSEIEGSTSLTVARHSRPQLSQRVADLSNALHGLLRIIPLRRVPPDTAPASRVPACLRDKIPMLDLDLGMPLVEQVRAPSPVSGGHNAPGARRCGTFLRYPVHTSVAAGARGKTSCGAHVCLCTCRQYARVPSLTCNILPQLPFEQQAYARCVLQKPCVIRVSCQCAAMPVPGTPVGGERATGSIVTEPQRSTSVEDTDEDFRDPEATLLDPIVLPERRWGHYAKWAMRHTDRLVPLIDKPT